MEKGKYWLSTFLLLVVLTSSVYFVLNDEVRVDIKLTYSDFSVYEDGKWVLSGREYVNLFDGSAKMRASARTIEISTYLNDTIVTRTAQYKNNILVVETYIFDNSTSDITLFPISHDIRVIGAYRPDRPYILQYEVQKLLYTGETESDVISPQSFGHKMEVEWEEGNYYSRIFKYSGRDEGKLTVKYRIDSDRFEKNVRLFDPPAPHLSSTLFNPEDNFISDTISNNFSSIILSNGSAIQNSSLYIKPSGGIWQITDTITFKDGNYTLDIYADSLNTAEFEINNVNATEISNGVWRITSSESDYETQRAQVIKTLFYGTNGADPRATSTYITNPISIISNDERDDGMRGHYSRVTYSMRTIGYMEGAMTGTDNDVTLWAYGSCNEAGNGCFSGQTYSFNGTTILTMPTSGVDITTDYTGTTTFQNFLDPFITRMSGGSISFGVTNINREILLSNGNISFSYTRTFCGSGCGESFESTDFLNDEGFPKIIYNGLSNFTVNFTEDVVNSTIWNIEVCNEDGVCEFADSNRTIIPDTFFPLINITYPENLIYFIGLNVSDLNYTAYDDNPDKCWYSLDRGITNSSTFAFGTNFTGLSSVLGQNKWTVYCNDTLNKITSAIVEFNVSLVGFTINATNTTIPANFNEQDWIFSQVNVSDLSEKNITFYLAVDDVIFESFSSIFQLREYNFTGLRESLYEFYVEVCDTDDNCYTTRTRQYGTTSTGGSINISLNGLYENIIAELGGDILINATSNISVVYIDIDHPEYGINYSISVFDNSFDLIIDYFRKNIINDSSTSAVLEFIGEQIIDLFFPAHQYDEVVGMAFNIYGTSTTQYPEDIQINKSNSTEIDRIFPGKLIGSNIVVNETIAEIQNHTLFYSFSGQKFIYFFMDKAADLSWFTFNITGSEFGFEFTDNYIDNSNTDQILSDAFIGGGFLLPGGINPLQFTYDTYNSIIDTTRWFFTIANGIYNTEGDSGDRYGFTIANSESNDYIRLFIDNFNEQFTGDNNGAATVFNSLWLNKTELNIWTTPNIEFDISYEFLASEDQDINRCNGDYNLLLGLVEFWVSPGIKRCGDYLGGGDYDDCIEIADTNNDFLHFNLTRQINNSWLVEVSGSERRTGSLLSSVPGPTNPNCGAFVELYNYTSKRHTIDYSTNNDDCVDSNVSISNTWYINNLLYDTSFQLVFQQSVTGSYQEETSKGCKTIDSNMDIYHINQTLYNIVNSSYFSDIIKTTTSDIELATLNVSSTLFAPFNDTFDVFAFLSADAGLNYESILPEVEHTFSNNGMELKYSYNFIFGNGGYLTNIPFFHSTTVFTEIGFPNNLSFDFGNDGIIDATFYGELNDTNSPTTINVSSADISSAFTTTTDYDHLFIIPLKVSSDSVGNVFFDNFNLSYNPNPIILNHSNIQTFLSNSINYVDFPISIEATGGNITIEDIKYDYAGGNYTIEITAHNADYSQSIIRNITYYYSRWEYEFVPLNVNWLEFIPLSPTSDDVTPFGQTNSIPILNFTNIGYGVKTSNLSIYLDGMEDTGCVNLTMSLDNNKSNGIQLNESWLELTNNLGYLDSVDLYMWADYECNYTSWRLFNPDIYLRQCVEGGVCSTDLI